MILPSRQTAASKSERSSVSYSPAKMGVKASRNCSKGMSVMKPSRPWLMPTSGVPNGTTSRAKPSMVPSPPTTTAKSQRRPSSSGSSAG